MPRKGYKLTPEHRAAISAGNKGHKRSAATRAAISAGLRGNTNCVGRSGERHPRWGGDDVQARAVHKRLDKERGKASEHVCADGCGQRAADWSFDEPSGFSTDLSRYTPRCRRCHNRRDAQARS